MSYRKLSVIIPVMNEAATIRKLIDWVKRVPLEGLEKEILVVDDGSKDGTPEILKGTRGIRTFFHDRNRGKGAALKTGIKNSTGDLLLLQDADLEYSPEDYPALLEPVLKGEAEFVMGSRFLYQRLRFFTRKGPPFFSHYIGNHLIIRITNLLYGQNHTDYEGCYKVFTKSLSNAIPIQADGFAFDNELICKSLRRGYRIVEVPIRYHPRLYSQGKKIKWKDGVLMLWTILKWRVLPF